MTKYDRIIHPSNPNDPKGHGDGIIVDVYCVLDAFGVTDQALGHAIKKLLCAGLRGLKPQRQDLEEAIQSIQRSITLSEQDLPFTDSLGVGPALDGTGLLAQANEAARPMSKADKKRAKMDRRNERRKKARASARRKKKVSGPASPAAASGRKSRTPARPPADLAPAG